jgi:hypothetical protein
MAKSDIAALAQRLAVNAELLLNYMAARPYDFDDDAEAEADQTKIKAMVAALRGDIRRIQKY